MSVTASLTAVYINFGIASSNVTFLQLRIRNNGGGVVERWEKDLHTVYGSKDWSFQASHTLFFVTDIKKGNIKYYRDYTAHIKY